MRLAITGMMGGELGRRLRRVLSAQFFNQITTIAVQLLLVPILLYAWGKETYGVWLLLSALPTYLTFSDLGFTLIAKNEMLMSTAAGRRDEALKVFHSVFALLNAVMPGVLIVSAILLLAIDPSAVLNLGGYPRSAARWVIMLLVVNVLSYQYFLLICGGVRSENRIATESMWGACARLGEGASVALVAISGGGLLMAAVAMVVVRTSFGVALYIWLRRASPWLYLGHRHAERSEIRRLIRPAFAFMLMPVSQALLIQAPILILGALSGPIAVVTFATTRTLTRLGTAATNMLNGTLQGEYAVAFGQGDAVRLHRLFRYHQLCSLAMVVAYCAALYVLKDLLMRFYTHGKVPVVEPFFNIMILVIAAEMVWSSIATPLSSVNRHVTLAHSLLAISIAGTGLCYVLTGRFDLTGTAIAMLIVHGVTILVCIALRHNMTLVEPAKSADVQPVLGSP